MRNNVLEIVVPDFSRQLARPLFASRVAAGFPSPADDYIEGRIDLNRHLILHPFATFYARVAGDSMETLIKSGELLVIDRMIETKDKDIVFARLDDDFCVKRLREFADGSVWLYSENTSYEPIRITMETDFEVWGKVLHSIQSF
ncbi:MAG TPA: translesion error-prone DNA polymerase V autoproteolytic subunit [Pyrinomonadaceae bacterium]|nr:translesion error-prone DNA polymerase V autoproteolytic subunit [Pyrinomonadaceae bacterium]